MGTLYILIGPSGAGKTTIGNWMARVFNNQFFLVVKRASREARPDDVDILGNQVIDIRGNDDQVGYTGNGGAFYLVNEVHIAEQLAAGRSAILVMNDPVIIDYLRRRFASVVVVFIHREMSEDMLREICRQRGLEGDALTQAVIARLLAAEALYRDLASGILRPDAVILNTEEGDLGWAYQQFVKIAYNKLQTVRKGVPTLYIVLAGTGSMKDHALRCLELFPRGRRLIVPKYVSRELREDDGAETLPWSERPPERQLLRYAPFGGNRYYAVDPQRALEILEREGVAFVTISDGFVAERLQYIVREAGMEARLVYLYQPVKTRVLDHFSRDEQKAREKHDRALLNLYQEQLITEGEVIIAKSVDMLSRAMLRRALDGMKM